MKESRVSRVCQEAAKLRKGKTVLEMSQHEAFVIANERWRLSQ